MCSSVLGEDTPRFAGSRKMDSKNRMAPVDGEKTKNQQTVLLVDDNEQNLELLEVYMEDLPELRVITARNGIEALQRVEEESPDLVLLDIMMPKMSGFEVCKRLKSNPETRDIIIIMVTALNETGDIERAAECGTDDYLAKPIDRKTLVDLVRSQLAARAKS
jgi:two-component system alkaline phosphatase synthesis response regulator PhoP